MGLDITRVYFLIVRFELPGIYSIDESFVKKNEIEEACLVRVN